MNLNLLFDTHSFIWWADEPTKLSRAALAALEIVTVDSAFSAYPAKLLW